jgi:hypothetical protein
MNYEQSEQISVEFEGRKETARLIISGKQKLSFTVEYRGETLSDGRSYGTSKEELHNLHVMAESILLRMINDFKHKYAH